MRTLVVEDDFMSRKLMCAYLSQYGECDAAANGAEAIEAFNTTGKPYDLITLDIMMPGISGQDVLKRIRSIEEQRGFAQVKIIMTTALESLGNILTAFENQCDGYLVKPIASEKLLEKLHELSLVDIQ
ncbi:MAG: response regulator [Desulfuromonadaceae bacterium]